MAEMTMMGILYPEYIDKDKMMIIANIFYIYNYDPSMKSNRYYCRIHNDYWRLIDSKNYKKLIIS